jgi:hypothetical protein
MRQVDVPDAIIKFNNTNWIIRRNFAEKERLGVQQRNFFDGRCVFQKGALSETMLEGRNNQRGMDNTGLPKIEVILIMKGRDILQDQSEDGQSNFKSRKGS